MFGQNFSELYYAISGNSAYGETLKVVFLLPYVNDKIRKACSSCVKKYAVPLGQTVPIGAVPVNMYETSELYMMGGYCFVQEALRTLSSQVKIEIYIASLNDCEIIENKPVIRNAYHLNPIRDSLSLRKKISDYYCDALQHGKFFPIAEYFSIEPLQEDLAVDFKTILHIGDYSRRYNKNFFFKTCLAKRIIIRDVDIARPATSFGIEDEIRLSLAIVPEKNQVKYFRRHTPSEAGAFVTHYKNIVLSFVNEHNEPEYIYFNKDYIDPHNYKEELYNFIALYMNKVEDIHVKSPLLVAMPLHTADSKIFRGIIYNGQILPVGILRMSDIDYSNIYLQPQYDNIRMTFHSKEAILLMNSVMEKLTKKLPFYFYAIDYMIDENKNIVICGIKTLRTQDLGLVGSLSEKYRSYVDKYLVENDHLFRFNLCENIIDSVVVSQLRDLMMGFARNCYLERFAI